MIDNVEELVDELSDLIGDNFSIKTNSKGQIIILTGLCENDDGELETFVSDEDLDEDLDIDPEQEPLDLDDE
jgi:hypothetical protein